MGLKGPVPSTLHNKYPFPIVDEYSNFRLTFPSPNTHTSIIINSLPLFGIPSYIHTNSDLCFSAELNDFFHGEGIEISRTTPYNFQCNGQIKSLNGTLWGTINLAIRTRNLEVGERSPWCASLHPVLIMYGNTSGTYISANWPPVYQLLRRYSCAKTKEHLSRIHSSTWWSGFIAIPHALAFDSQMSFHSSTSASTHWSNLTTCSKGWPY